MNVTRRFPVASFSLALVALVGFLLGEFVLLRLLFREILHVRIGWGEYLTDFDLFLPLPTAAALLAGVLATQTDLRPKLNRASMVFHLVVLVCFVAMTARFANAELPPSWRDIWWGVAILNFGSSLFLFYRPRDLLSPSVAPAMLCAAVIAFLPTFFRKSPDSLWDAFALWTTRGVVTLLEWIFGTAVGYKTLPLVGIRILTPDLVVQMAKGCTGLDGILLCLMTTSLLLATFRFRGNLVSWAGALLTGIATIFILNIVRISVLVWVGGKLFRTLDRAIAQSIFETLFHTHLGWILYLLGLFVVFRAFRPWEQGKLVLSRTTALRSFIAIALTSTAFFLALAPVPVMAENPPCNTTEDCDPDYCVCDSNMSCPDGQCVGAFFCNGAGAANATECINWTGYMHYYRNGDNGPFCEWTGSSCEPRTEPMSSVPELPFVAFSLLPVLLGMISCTGISKRS